MRDSHSRMYACLHRRAAGIAGVAYGYEVAGYFASFLWRRGQGYPMPDPGENNFVKILCDLAVDARKANVRGDVFKFPDSAVNYLKRIIITAYQLPRDFLEVGKSF